jgi:cell division transport system permease protein
MSSLGRLWRNPLPNILSAAVIGIALALPATLFTLLDNVRSVSEGWGEGTDLTLFLGQDVGLEHGHSLALELEQEKQIGAVSVIDPDLALAEFRELSGFGAALDLLADNPLPVALVVTPVANLRAPPQLADLATRLGTRPEVDTAQIDMQWVTRWHALLRVIGDTVVIVGALLGIAVLLVVGNTIRLDIENRREEIVVVKLVGGTDAFIRRPFLFGGAWLGVLGGLCAWAMVEIALALLATPVRQLADLYGASFTISGPGLDGLLDLVTAGVILGILGAWLAVGQQLRRIEPS